MLVVITPVQWFKVHSKIVRLIMGLFVFRTQKIKEMWIFIKVNQKQMANTIARLIPLTTQMRQQRSYRFSLHLLQVKDM